MNEWIRVRANTKIVPTSNLQKMFCFVEESKASATVDGLDLSDKRADLSCWLRSVFKSRQRRFDVSLFQDSISNGRTIEATLYVPCLDCGRINHSQNKQQLDKNSLTRKTKQRYNIYNKVFFMNVRILTSDVQKKKKKKKNIITVFTVTSNPIICLSLPPSLLGFVSLSCC